MPVNTFSAAAHIAPVAVKTFYRHTKRKGRKLREHDERQFATDDIFFDEAFNIVKAFIILGTKNTVESLQAFTNTHVPAPFWAAVAPVLVPFHSCNQAADVLMEWFGPEDLKLVVGGERWWQVRGLDGIDAEWIAEKQDLPDVKFDTSRKLSDAEKDILRMEKLDRIMFYIHGGGYFWGSINTHRYQIIRYARKMKGCAFSVNYRKAPQYPWPCALQDVLASYLYLIDPPPDAIHQPIPPEKIVFAGDSAGGGLCLTTLTILRDMGIPLPAGAVLISPWVDLTHSFPSVLTNSETDIIPPHGFLAKPSVLWPIDPVKDDGRVIRTESNPPPKPGHADTPFAANVERKELGGKEAREADRRMRVAETHDVGEKDTGSDHLSHDRHQVVESQEEMMSVDRGKDDVEDEKYGIQPKGDQEEASKVNGQTSGSGSGDNDSTLVEDIIGGSGDDKSKVSGGRGPAKGEPSHPDDLGFIEPKPPKVLMKNMGDVPLELRSQIQLYATTEQLSHPLVSPVIQGSLGNLCPLYILAGDGEVLRDEVIHLAHRAAHPEEYPAREGIIREGWRQKENAKKFTTPTKVHLQVFDGMCHVLTVFTFTESAKYAYRSIAEFAKHVTSNSPEHLARNPFPELHRPAESISSMRATDHEHPSQSKVHKAAKHMVNQQKSPAPSDIGRENVGVDRYKENEEKAAEEVKEGEAEMSAKGENGERSKEVSVKDPEHDIPHIFMIRERVDIHGRVRPMEPKEEIAALRLKPSEIGIIKEDPLNKWLHGQQEWDKRYRRTAIKVIKRRLKFEAQAKRMLVHAREQGLILSSDDNDRYTRVRPERMDSNVTSSSRRTARGNIQEDRRWGPLDLDDERPPASAIAGRRDTPEALALMKKSIYNTAPVTHKTVPKLKTFDAIRAAFDPNDDPFRPPQQSVSEQQVHSSIMHIHGLRVWESLVSYFMRKSSLKAADGTKHAGRKLAETTDKIGFGSESNGNQSRSETIDKK